MYITTNVTNGDLKAKLFFVVGVFSFRAVLQIHGSHPSTATC